MSKSLIPAVGYVRMSTDKQEDSPARQRGEIERLAERSGYSIIAWYEDHGLTGTESANRPEFQRLMTDAKSGRFRAVLMYELSRFSREDALDAMMHWRALRDAGVKLVTCQRGEMRFDDLAGLITALVGQHKARAESIRLAQRVLSGRQMKARKGIHLVTTPIGFDREIVDENGQVVRRVACGERFVRPKTWRSQLVPMADESIASAIRSAFDAVIAGRSLRSIAVDFNRRGLRTRQGKMWNTNKLQRLLRNPVYAGVLRFGHDVRGKFARCDEETIFVGDAHPGLVTVETFQQVQTVLDARQYHRNLGDPGRYLLSGIVHCVHCGRRMGERTSGTPRTATDGSSTIGAASARRARTTAQSIRPWEPRRLSASSCGWCGNTFSATRTRDELNEAVRQLQAKRGEPNLDEQQLAEIRRKIERGEQNLGLADGANFEAIARLLDSWREQEKKILARLRQESAPTAKSAIAMKEALVELAEVREHLHLASRVLLAAALRDSVLTISVGRDSIRQDGMTHNWVYGTVAFDPTIVPQKEIRFDDWDLHDDSPYVRIADYVQRAGRIVRAAELGEVLKVKSPIYHARRAVLAGLIQQKTGERGFYFDETR